MSAILSLSSTPGAVLLPAVPAGRGGGLPGAHPGAVPHGPHRAGKEDQGLLPKLKSLKRVDVIFNY